MHRRIQFAVLTGSSACVLAAAVWAGDDKKPAADPPPAQQADASRAAGSGPVPAVPSRLELEKEFQSTLTGATLRGTWQMTGEGGLRGNSALTPAAEESYTILSVAKGLDDYWIINARIKFGDKDVTFPVPVRVVWAEDTPIITVNELPVPGVGTYSARVMIYKGFYCGTWLSTAKNYGGVMSGRVYHDNPASTPSPGAPTEKKP